MDMDTVTDMDIVTDMDTVTDMNTVTEWTFSRKLTFSRTGTRHVHVQILALKRFKFIFKALAL
jgi:hypothetical protein